MKPVCLSVMWEAITSGLLPWKQNNLNAVLCNVSPLHRDPWWQTEAAVPKLSILSLKMERGWRDDSLLYTETIASCTNTPGARPVYMATGPHQPLKTQPQKNRCLRASRIHYTPVRFVDNNRTAKHEPTMLVCLMFPGSFFLLLLLSPFFNLSFNRRESEKAE